MAAPASKTIHDLNGKWTMNKSLSDPFEPVLSLQGIGFLTRKGIAAATVTLSITQSEGPPSDEAQPPLTDEEKTEKVVHVHIDQTLTGGIKGTSEHRCVDNRKRGHSDWLFGSVVGYSTWAKGADAPKQAVEKLGGDAFLGEGFVDGADLLLSHVVNQDTTSSGGWVACQAWGFQEINGERRYVRKVVVTKGDKRIAVTLVYDYLGEL